MDKIMIHNNVTSGVDDQTCSPSDPSLKYVCTNELTRGTPASAGLDIKAIKRTVLASHSIERIQTSLSVEIPEGFWGMLTLRSSIAKRGFSLANGIGVIDSDYRGPVDILLLNTTSYPMIVEAGERIAQLILVPMVSMPVIKVDELPNPNTIRGTGGFGSTGTH